jgi:NADPH:quinone reductase
MVVYGQAGPTAARLDPLVLQDRNQSVTGYYVGHQFAARPTTALDALRSLVESITTGRLEVQIGHMLALDAAPEAHRLLESRQAAGKIVLLPWSD